MHAHFPVIPDFTGLNKIVPQGKLRCFQKFDVRSVLLVISYLLLIWTSWSKTLKTLLWIAGIYCIVVNIDVHACILWLCAFCRCLDINPRLCLLHAHTCPCHVNCCHFWCACWGEACTPGVPATWQCMFVAVHPVMRWLNCLKNVKKAVQKCFIEHWARNLKQLRRQDWNVQMRMVVFRKCWSLLFLIAL